MRFKGFEPCFGSDSEILVLGSFPSVKSREAEFYYGNPRNGFWRVMSDIYSRPLPEGKAEKINFLRQCRIALWDIVTECDIKGSLDSDIKNYEIADITGLLAAAPVKAIFTNGKTAGKLLLKYYPELESMTCVLPSTSPANTRFDAGIWREALAPYAAAASAKSQG